MTYGVEAVIPLETGFPTLRTSSITLSNNDELLGKILDLIEERRRKCYGPISQLLAQAQIRVRCQCEAKITNAWRLGVMKGFGYGKEPSMGKVRAQLRKAISHHLSG